MNAHRSPQRFLPRAAVAGLALGAAACSSPPVDVASSSDALSRATSPLEAARVQAYLDSIYTAKDVRHSFRSAMGETIDCADFASAPGVRRLLAQGKTMDDIMAPIREAVRPASGAPTPNPAYYQGDLDEAGQARSCPAGTYPHVRLTPEHIAARGGLDAYLTHGHPASTVPINGGYQQDTGHYAWVQTDFSPAATLSSVQGGTSTMTIAKPTLSPYAGDHSVAQIWLTGADHFGQVRQTIETGWEAVGTGAAVPTQPYLFIGTTPNAYGTWCQDDNTSPACPAWVPNPTASLGFGTPLPTSTPGGVQHELTVTIQHQYSILISCIIRRGCTETKIYRGWGIWASVDGGGADTYLGYYENNAYSNTTDGNSGLNVGGDDFLAGGEVYDSGEVFGPPPEVTMGEGPLPQGKATYGSSAYHHDFGYYDTNNNLVTDGSTIHYSNTSYVFDITTPPGSAAWANYFYYGDYSP